ncbi:MAG: polysulfide reductase [SAR324 cluster bacterium]|uniref:Polysulfide reductase n=1 Tax=SAR324 cluster bacterium TaxID=2024889 RepID=A0A2A4T3M3_9DELT|nr:MAG: polysulfide reductase [SAR324 cluster bacterium]
MGIIHFFTACFKELLKGGAAYWIWVTSLMLLVIQGVVTYAGQLQEGLIKTGMSDQVSWGIYVANFTFLVGMAAAAVMLVIPAYIFHNKDAKRVVILAEGLAVAASLMCMLFVTVDMGRPDRLWHLMPIVGHINFPYSLLTWDVLVLNGYLILNLLIPMYLLYNKYMGKEGNYKLVLTGAVLSMFWAISIHTVTAFLFSSNTARPFWSSALHAPKFLASAFAAGPAFIILSFKVIDMSGAFKIGKKTINLLAIIVTVALQINLLMTGAEFFAEFYSEGAHSASARYLFFGLNGADKLVPWIYSAIAMSLIALVLLMIRQTREHPITLSIACVLVVIGVWIEKGMGFVIPGFIPTPIGEIFEYTPNMHEVQVSLGIWGIGLLVFTALVKAAIPIQNGVLTHSK